MKTEKKSAGWLACEQAVPLDHRAAWQDAERAWMAVNDRYDLSRAPRGGWTRADREAARESYRHVLYARRAWVAYEAIDMGGRLSATQVEQDYPVSDAVSLRRAAAAIVA